MHEAEMNVSVVDLESGGIWLNRLCRDTYRSAFHFSPKRVSPSISVNTLTCEFGITRHPHEGGDGAERGAKLGATARKPWGKGSSVSVRRLKVQFNQTEVSSGVWAR